MKIIILLISIFLLAQCASKKQIVTPMPFDWLLGDWKMETTNETTLENWVRTDSTYLGNSAVGKNGTKPKPFETVEIKKVGRYYEYIATTVSDLQTTAFKIIKYSRNGFTAVNEKHDFPKRIVYQLYNSDSLIAYIDDNLQKSKKRYYFNYKKK
jgi:hypothetical protein